MGVLAPSRLDQLFDDVLRRRLIGVAHAEVDDVLAPSAGLGLQVIDDVEDVGRQAFDALEVGVQGYLPKRLSGRARRISWCRRRSPAGKAVIPKESISLTMGGGRFNRKLSELDDRPGHRRIVEIARVGRTP